MPITDIVNHMFITSEMTFLVQTEHVCSVLIIRQEQFSSRSGLKCHNGVANMDILGVSVYLPCLVVNLNGNRIKICGKIVPLYLIS